MKKLFQNVIIYFLFSTNYYYNNLYSTEHADRYCQRRSKVSFRLPRIVWDIVNPRYKSCYKVIDLFEHLKAKKIISYDDIMEFMQATSCWESRIENLLSKIKSALEEQLAQVYQTHSRERAALKRRLNLVKMPQTKKHLINLSELLDRAIYEIDQEIGEEHELSECVYQRITEIARKILECDDTPTLSLYKRELMVLCHDDGATMVKVLDILSQVGAITKDQYDLVLRKLSDN
jgi:hypothetical protein